MADETDNAREEGRREELPAPAHTKASILKARAATNLRELIRKEQHGWAKPEDYVAYIDDLMAASLAAWES
jgi:hypothetical protein